MEKERPKPPRPKHRTNIPEQRELPPPPVAPLLTDFIDENGKAEGSAQVDEEAKENRLEVQERFSKISILINLFSEKSDEKAKEANLSSSFVRELPLDALLPQTSESETNTSVNNSIEIPKQATPALIYPKLEPAKPLPQIVLNGDIVEERVIPTNHKNIYPNIREITARTFHGESELLNEAQLLTYYQNETLDFVEDFVDEFVSVCLD
jgi:hypothetical protein